MTPKYASYDGYPVRFTRYEAWIFVRTNKHWRRTEIASVLHEAAVLTETQFRHTFGHLPPLPPLPPNAFGGWR
jgi:hypothetical protein